MFKPLQVVFHGLGRYGRLSCFFICIACTANSMAQQTVELVGDPWPPYVKGELGEFADSGIAIAIINRIFAQIDGVEVRFPLIPWKRAMLEVERGHSDGIPMLLKTAEREDFMVFTEPLLTGYNLVWSIDSANGAFEWDSIENLYGKNVGVVEGYSYGQEMDRGMADGLVNSVKAPTVERLFAMLAAGRVDLIMANDAVGYEIARGYENVKIRPARRPTNSETFYIGLSKKSPVVGLLPQINQAISNLQRDGVIARIVRGEPDSLSVGK